jgi:hypothetical protein
MIGVLMLLRGLLCVIGLALAAASASAPSGSQTLGENALIYTPPADWKSLGMTHDNLSAGYAPADKSAQIVLVAVREPQTIPDDLGPKLALQFGQTIRAEAKKGNIQIVTQPKAEEDKRFLLKLHDQFRAKGKFGDRTQLFRGVGKFLVSVTATAFTEDADQQQKVEQIAEDVMLSVRLNQPGAAPAPGNATAVKPAATTQPILFAAAHLRLTPPGDWIVEQTNQPNGLLATWHDPASSSDLIALTYREAPAGTDADAMDAAVDQLAAGETPTVASPDAKPLGPAQTIVDHRFLRKTSTDYQLNDAKLRVTMREIRAGDGVVSVTNIATTDRADGVDALADQVALGVRATR